MSSFTCQARDCLGCSNSFSADNEEGEQILMCANCPGYEGTFVEVEENFICANYN